MSPVEIAALAEAGIDLIVKVAGLVQAAQKGDVAAAEALKTMVERSGQMKEIVDEAHAYLDEQFDKSEP
jgi:hypothetical protein